MTARAPRLLATLLGLVGAAAATAQTVVIVEVDPIPCAPREENVVITATVTPDKPDQEARLYFQRDSWGELYYLPMMPLGGGRYWAVMPRPEKQNDAVEYHVNVVGPHASGIEVSANRGYQNVVTLASSPRTVTPVTDDCEVEMTDEQRDFANRLRVGETTISQKGRPVAWFMCEGIIERINIIGEVRPDEFCGVPPTPVPITVAEGMQGGGPPAEVSPSRP